MTLAEAEPENGQFRTGNRRSICSCRGEFIWRLGFVVTDAVALLSYEMRVRSMHNVS